MGTDMQSKVPFSHFLEEEKLPGGPGQQSAGGRWAGGEMWTYVCRAGPGGGASELWRPAEQLSSLAGPLEG